MTHRLWGVFLFALVVAHDAIAASSRAIVCFYGPPDVERLAGYGTVVLQPSRTTPSDVAALKSRGCRVLGYVSLGEDDRLRRGDGRGPGGYASWYIDEYAGAGFGRLGPDGKPDVNADWGSRYVDPSNRDWRRAVRAEVRYLRDGLGMDGVFADTVHIPPDVFTRDRERRMTAGMRHLLRSLKTWSRGGAVIVNNGEDFAPTLGRRIDGLMVEMRIGADAEAWNDLRMAAERLTRLRRSSDDLITALIYLVPDVTVDQICTALKPFSIPAAVYADDDGGRTLTAFPAGLCP